MKEQNPFHIKVIREAFEPYLRDRFFTLSVLHLGGAGLGVVVMGALFGSMFGLASTFAVAIASVLAFLVVLYGPIIDKAIALQADNALEIIYDCFAHLQEKEQKEAAKHIMHLEPSEISEVLTISLFGTMSVRFRVGAV